MVSSFERDSRVYRILSEEKANLDQKLIELNTHADALSEYFNCFNDLVCCGTWFHIGGAIRGLDYDGILYDDSFMMCRPAYEYEIEKQKLYSNLVKEINVFLFIYSGLENLISFCDFPRHPLYNGKISSATFAIKQKFNSISPMLKYYDATVCLCERMFQESIDPQYKIANELTPVVDIFGLGLKLVYKVRNKIMHGDFFFPEPYDYGGTIPFHPAIINLCSRLALMSVQMLLIVYKDNNFDKELEIYNSSILRYDEETHTHYVNERNYLRGLHVKQIDFKEFQYELKFKD